MERKRLETIEKELERLEKKYNETKSLADEIKKEIDETKARAIEIIEGEIMAEFFERTLAQAMMDVFEELDSNDKMLFLTTLMDGSLMATFNKILEDKLAEAVREPESKPMKVEEDSYWWRDDVDWDEVIENVLDCWIPYPDGIPTSGRNRVK